jgi:hypothetical protein
VVRAGHNKDRAIKNKNKLQAIKRFKLSYTKATGQLTDGKGTENMLNDMMMKEMYEYQIDFDTLLRKMPKLDGQIDLIRQLRQRG